MFGPPTALPLDGGAYMEDYILLLESGMGMDLPLKNIRPNIVQSIRAFSVTELQDAAEQLGQHFLYAKLASALTKQDVLDLLVQQFKLVASGAKNFDALYDSMTDTFTNQGHRPDLSWCWSRFLPMPNSTRKGVSNCWTSSVTQPITGEPKDTV
jgi:hypothetical protein